MAGEGEAVLRVVQLRREAEVAPGILGPDSATADRYFTPETTTSASAAPASLGAAHPFGFQGSPAQGGLFFRGGILLRSTAASGLILLRKFEEFDRVEAKGSSSRARASKASRTHGEENALCRRLLPPDQAERASLFDPLVAIEQDVVVRRDEDAPLLGGVLEEGRVLRLLAEFSIGVLGRPSPGFESPR